MNETDYVLNTPIQAHGEELTHLTLRPPTVAECRAIKTLPYTLSLNSDEVSMNLDAVAKYISVCAAIPASTVNQLAIVDLNALAWILLGFFSNSASEAKGATSTI